MNVNLGTPYENVIKRIIEKGYAGNQTEVIRQALLSYERFIEEEEVRLVRKGVEEEMKKYDEGKIGGSSLEEVKARLDKKRKS